MFVFFFTISITTINYLSNILLKEAKVNGSNISTLFAKINSSPLKRMDYYAIENNTKEILKTPNISYAEVYDNSKTKVNYSGEKDKNNHSINVLPFTKKIIDDKKNNIGYVIVGLSLKDTNKIILNIKIIFYAIMITAIIIIIFSMTFVIKKIVNKPLDELLNSVQIISNGNLDHKVSIISNNEIGILSNNFNKMTDKLKENKNKLKEYNQNLEKKVIEKTTEIEKKMKELEEKNVELNKALKNIKTLQGLLPICANCYKIKDDKGYWTQIEKYISENSEADFTHSLCDDCVKELYPNYHKKKTKNLK